MHGPFTAQRRSDSLASFAQAAAEFTQLALSPWPLRRTVGVTSRRRPGVARGSASHAGCASAGSWRAGPEPGPIVPARGRPRRPVPVAGPGSEMSRSLTGHRDGPGPRRVGRLARPPRPGRRRRGRRCSRGAIRVAGGLPGVPVPRHPSHRPGPGPRVRAGRG